MPPKTIISDWNGTLFEYATDEIQNKKLAYAVLDDAKRGVRRGRIWRIADVFGLMKTKSELKKRLQEYHSGKRHLWEVYEPFNKHVVRGRPVSFVNGVIDEFAHETAGKVDGRILIPIQNAHLRGNATGILSVSYDYAIRKLLQEAGYSDVFDTVIANTLETKGDRALGFTLKIYGEKAKILKEEFFEKRHLRESDIVYFGDSEDDEPIAAILPPGNFIVPFLASNDYRQKLGSKYKAFVPQSGRDLDDYLKKM